MESTWNNVQGYYLKYVKLIEDDIINLIKLWYENEKINKEYCKTNTTLLWKGSYKDNINQYRIISYCFSHLWILLWDIILIISQMAQLGETVEDLVYFLIIYLII